MGRIACTVRGVIYVVVLALVIWSVETTIVNDTDWERIGSVGNVLEQVAQFIGIDWGLLPGLVQPAIETIVGMLQGTDRDTGLDIRAIREISDYWEAVRAHYAAFESGMQAPASEVYLHEMPGGQFTNLKAQARSIGLERRRSSRSSRPYS